MTPAPLAKLVKRLPCLVLLAFLATAFAGCTGPDSEITLSHVHGLAYDPEAQALFVATHDGLAEGTEDEGGWTWSYVGDDRYDYMGFTQDAERYGVFYSSGHPDDPRGFGGAHLGLRRSMDGGETWEQRSLKGDVDFHALTGLPGAEGRLAGHWQGTIKVSADGGATWTDLPAPEAHVLALAAGPDTLFAGTTEGLHVSHDLERLDDWERVETRGLSGPVATLSASRDGAMLFAATWDGRSGATYRSLDGGADWSGLSEAHLREVAAPVHFAIDGSDPTHVFASTMDAHILESHDQGVTWTTIRAP